MKIERICIEEASYPPLLKKIEKPPNPLYYIGDLGLASQRCVAVVGARKATEYGHWAARQLGRRLAENQVVVVSGMAKGIDGCAHKGALATGKTIAVLGCGVNVCYPPSNRKLRQDILKEGLLLSEYQPDTEPAPYRFPQRNRIISGIAEATVVVQAGNNSGALITAELAADQGRSVYAIPGNIDNPYHLGSNKLLKDGAMPLVVVDDLLEDMQIQTLQEKKIEKMLGEDENLVFSALQKGGEMTVDQICSAIGQPVQMVSGIVTILEMKGIIFTALGKVFIAK